MVLVALIGLTVYIVGYKKRHVNDTPGIETQQSARVVGQSQATSGVYDINDSDVWVGVSCLDGSKRIEGKILTKGVYWQVRLDGDDSRIHTLFPGDWKEKSNLDVGKHNLQEWRILPGQAIKKGKVAWQIVPRKSG